MSKDIEGIVETVEQIADDYLAIIKMHPSMKRSQLIGVLQSQADQYDREKGEMVRDIPNALHKYGAWLLVNYEDVAPSERRAKKQEITETIAQKYSVDLSE